MRAVTEKRRGHRKGPFRSQSQWRWAFASGKEFAHRWAEEIVAERGPKTGYRSLPGNKAGNHSARTVTAKQRTRSNAMRKALVKRG